MFSLRGVYTLNLDSTNLGEGQGDRLLIVETPSGVELTAYDSEVAEQLAVAEGFMRRHRDVLRKLAE